MQVHIDGVVEQYEDCRNSLKLFFSMPEYSPERFALMSPIEVKDELAQRLMELDKTHSLILLASIEAMFRIDFERRCNSKLKDDLSRKFRRLQKAQGNKIRFDEELLDAWKELGLISSKLVGELRSAMQLRHWLAHGRYWTFKSGNQFDFEGIFALADALQNSSMLKK
jgi:hypothetical protein